MSEVDVDLAELETRAEKLDAGLHEMIETGVGVVDLLDTDQCAAIVDQFDPRVFQSSPTPFDPIRGRQQYWFKAPDAHQKAIDSIMSDPLFTDELKQQRINELGPLYTLPNELWQIRTDIVSGFVRLADEHPEFTHWSWWADSGMGPKKDVHQVIRYPEGMNVAPHVDEPDGKYPSQALLTLAGEGKMKIYAPGDQEFTTPIREIDIMPGRLVLLGGSELPGHVQLPHEVEHYSPRIMYNIGGDKTRFDQSQNQLAFEAQQAERLATR